MKLKNWGLKARLFRAEHLPSTATLSLFKKNVCEPYVTLAFGDASVQPSASSPVVPQTQVRPRVRCVWSSWWRPCSAFVSQFLNTACFVCSSSVLFCASVR